MQILYEIFLLVPALREVTQMCTWMTIHDLAAHT
jgi:hypothetical protein